MSRRPGRHRIGIRPGPVQPRRWDLAKQAAAAQLDQLEPIWCVLYGVGSRRFHAIAVWHTTPLRVEATTVQDLRELMREAELQNAWSSAQLPVGTR
ncbi:hypothetical protein GCM10022226_60690 [Sphaerisporangium flaviroseum]|uniref:Uncharacterized protein n=1 Tax=Sphaerisporangium flaviroseum TaxID=509199 RepID=A0ABP7J043_9ACTN